MFVKAPAQSLYAERKLAHCCSHCANHKSLHMRVPPRIPRTSTPSRQLSSVQTPQQSAIAIRHLCRWYRCAKKWRDRFVASPAVSAEKLAEFDEGSCPACLAICACKKCMSSRSLKAGGGPPRFTPAQQREFAVHTLAMLKPHLDNFKATRSAEVPLSVLCLAVLRLQGCMSTCINRTSVCCACCKVESSVKDIGL